MRLPFEPPIEPMLAKPSDGLPEGDGWLFEPKWDGFRAIVFRDGETTSLISRDERPFERYFPELIPALEAALRDEGPQRGPQPPAALRHRARRR